SAAAALAHTTKATATHARGDARHSHGIKDTGFGFWRQVHLSGTNSRLKEETHAARWGLLRGCSRNATKWVDFVVAASTRRETCHASRVVRNAACVKG